MNQSDYLKYCAIAMLFFILLLTVFVSLWCLVSACFAVVIIAIADYLAKEVTNEST